jgi:hypothetical protein
VAPDGSAPYGVPVTPHELRRQYDAQLRREAEVAGARRVDEDGPLLRAVMDWGGFVTYRDLAGLEGAALDGAIARAVAFFRGETDVARFEWKTRGHDEPADLGARLVAQGLVAEPEETVMMGEAALLAVDVPLPAGVTVRRAGDGGRLRDDVARMLALQEEVFGPGRGPRLEDVLAAIELDGDEHWLAEVDGEVVSAGRLSPVPGTDVAGLWGGATRADWRGRGIYRALTAARAGSALARGVRLLHSDCTPMSRPILERSGLLAVTTTTPYVWTR